MLQNATVEDVATLLDLDVHRSSIREFNPDTKSLQSVTMPWLVVWLMVRYNRKHTLCSDRLPHLDSF
jgi:hypothetical protein